MNLIKGFVYAIIAQVLTFVQLQGQFRWQWFKDHPFLVATIAGIPISLLYIYSVKYLVPAFDGEKWPARLISFAVGATVFTVMSWSWFKEPITPKTFICLIMALGILLIQLFWK